MGSASFLRQAVFFQGDGVKICSFHHIIRYYRKPYSFEIQGFPGMGSDPPVSIPANIRPGFEGSSPLYLVMRGDGILIISLQGVK